MIHDLSNKQGRIAHHVAQIMRELGVTEDDSTADTPRRVAKMYLHELFAGLNPDNAPKVTVQANSMNYRSMLLETNITVHSVCEHHLVPIIGVAHVAYVPDQQVLGLSKFNRLVDYYARRPQVQERLTQQVAQALARAAVTHDVAVVIDAAHMCVRLRGIKDRCTVTRTVALQGQFADGKLRDEFMRSIPGPQHFSL